MAGENRYRVPDRRYRSGYRLTREGEVLQTKVTLLVTGYFVALLVGLAESSWLIPILATLAVVGYGVRHRRVNRRLDGEPPPPVYMPPPPVYMPPPPPRGERRTRQAIPQAVKVAVAARDQGRCRCTRGYCHGHAGFCGSTMEPHFDHIIPWIRGGADTVGNLQILCGPCNRRKGADDIC